MVSKKLIYGAGERSRTPDLLITSQLLYQLSYAGLPIWTHGITHAFRRKCSLVKSATAINALEALCLYYQQPIIAS